MSDRGASTLRILRGIDSFFVNECEQGLARDALGKC
jgi:hypothetical protein